MVSSRASARASKVFALPYAAGLESRFLVTFSAAFSTRLSPSFIYARTDDETPPSHPPNFLVQDYL